MADRASVTISTSWNGTGVAPAGSVVQLTGFSFRPMVGGDSRQDGSVGIQITGAMTATLVFEGIIDSVNGAWFPIAAFPAQGVVGTHVTQVTGPGQWIADSEGLTAVRVRCSAYTSGSPIVTMASSFAGLSTATSGAILAPDNYTNIITNATTVIKSTVGVLHNLVINQPGASETLTLYDNTAGSGTKIGTIVPVAGSTYQYNIQFNTGLTIVSAGTTPGDYTVTWR